MKKFNNKYRIPSARLASWDYSAKGKYFITICTKNRIHFFGEIENGEMILNDTGKIAERCWLEIPDHFQFVELGKYIVMPNHVHGIIIINESNSGVSAVVETGHALSLPPTPTATPIPTAIPTQPTKPTHFRFRNQGKNSVSAMVGSFKSATTRLVKITATDFGWQTRFHDHIIRSNDEFVRISNYIVNNPFNWKEDNFNQFKSKTI